MRTSVLAFAVALATVACGGSPASPSDQPGSSGSSGSTGSTGSSGSLTIRITDSPYGSAKAVLVTFSEVSVQRNGNWTRLPFPDSAGTWTCDLKKLQNGNEDVLASGTPGLGEYTLVRFTLQSAKIFFDNSAVSATPCARSIAEPAGAASALTFTTREATVNGSYPAIAGVATTALIDFDGEASITQTGTNAYNMNPVIRLVSVR